MSGAGVAFSVMRGIHDAVCLVLSLSLSVYSLRTMDADDAAPVVE